MLKQNSGDNRCVAIVAAMATGTDPKEFEQFCNHAAPYTEKELAHFLFTRGLNCSLGIPGEYFKDMLDVSDSVEGEDYIQTGNPITPDSLITLRFRPRDVAAVIYVEENGNTMGHAIYWDGCQVWDPNPATANGRPLSSYKILGFYPIIKGS